MKEMFKLGFILALFAVVACTALALVNNVTAPLITAYKEAEAAAAMKAVFAKATSFESVPDFKPIIQNSVTIDKAFYAKENGSVIGAVVQAAGNTYDKAVMLVGVDNTKKITGIAFLTLTDTPGFGQKAKEPAFANQFAGKSATDNFTVKQDVNIITGATITSKGVANIVRTASQYADKALSLEGAK